MLRVAIDENFNHDIVRGVLRRLPDADVAGVLDAGLKRATDPEVLAWAADSGRILLTHDVSTITKYAFARVRDGLPMPGVFEVAHNSPLARVIDDLTMIISVSMEGEWEG
ncbi:MAG: DUF5615 family PIN-like protein [Chthoniobacteraceae bacterium]